jgi:hypothetical protein
MIRVLTFEQSAEGDLFTCFLITMSTCFAVLSMKWPLELVADKSVDIGNAILLDIASLL